MRPHKHSFATGAYYTRILPVPDGPTQFEQLVEQRGLLGQEELWVYDSSLRSFAQRNRHKRYIPESFLVTLRLGVEDVEL